MSEHIYEQLAKLTALNGVSGAEGPVAAYLWDAFAPLADRVEADRFGNVVAIRQGPAGARTLMLVAHSDEVGCVVHSILPDGLLRLEPMGFVSLRALPGARVQVGSVGLTGVVGLPSAHVDSKEGSGLLPFHALHVDVGASSEAEVRAMGISEGDPITFDAPLRRLGNGPLVTGKALDNRIGCAVLLELFRVLQGERLPITLLCAVAVQEEIGMRGAKMVATRYQPDLAIAIDTVPAEDTVVPAGGAPRIRLGGGPVVQLVEGVMAAYVGTVHHPAVRTLIMGAAKAAGVGVQLSVSGRWTTDAAAVHTAGDGIPTGFVSIPRRYAHSPAEVLNLADAERAVALLTEVVHRAADAPLGILPDL